MKILRIVFFVFFLLYIITVIWVGDDTPFKPIYWLVVELAGALIILIGLIFIRFRSKEETKISTLFGILFSILYVGYFLAYKPISQYKRNTCQDKFGRIFNKTRRLFGSPEIPGDWHIRSRGDGYVDWWKSEKDTIGHTSKTTFIDSICRIEFELDEYNFKPIKNVSRDLSVTTHYGHENNVNSIIYRYEEGNNNQIISKRQADSIFAVEKTTKDY